jgi:hypothetical protein
VRQEQRSIGRVSAKKAMIFERAAKLVGGTRTGHNDGATSGPRQIGMTGKATDGALKSAKVRCPE